MLLDRDGIVEGIHVLQFTGMDQGHEEVADAGAVFSLVEESIFSVQDALLQTSFHDVMPRHGLCRVKLVLAQPGAEADAIAGFGNAA